MSYDIGELDYNDEESLNYGADYPEHDMADVELNILDTKVSEESSHSEDEEEEDINNTRLEARMTAKIIQNLINDKENKHFEVYDRGTKTYRVVQYRDIVILLRSKRIRQDIIQKSLEILAYLSLLTPAAGILTPWRSGLLYLFFR